MPGTNRLVMYFAAVFGMLVLLAAPAATQVLYGSVVGTVEDPTGAIVPKAVVTLTSEETGQSREVTADESGRYSIPNVLPGRYNLKVTTPGFRTVTRENLNVTINTVTREDIQLEVGQVTEAVTVQASAVALQTDKTDVRSEISATALANLPLPTYRNYQSLINLVPGSTPAGFQNAVVDTPARALTTNVNGTARNNNNTLVDGASNIFIWLPHHTVYVQPAESIETVNVTTGSFDAEQGMAGGAAITVATKSGTNDLHGVAFWFHDNQHLKARPYFFRQSEPGADLPKGIFNQAGGTLGGPIVRNKLFFFGSFERTMERSGQSGNFSVPPADIRAGDFSRYAGLATIYDPLTGNPDGSGREPFPNNRIPAERISPIFNRIQSLVPLPNQRGEDAFGLIGNFAASGTQRLDRNNYDLKINWNTTDNLVVWGKYSRMDAEVTGPPALGEITGPGLGTLGTGDTDVNIPTFGFTYTISPTFLMDGVYGYTRFDQTVFGPDFGRNWGLEDWGIPGTNGGGLFPGDERYSGQPQISQGFTNWGNDNTWMPLFRNDRSHTYTTNFSKILPAHELRFGYEVRRHAMNHWQPETANPRGAITFDGVVTAALGATPQSINSYAAGLLGLPRSYAKSVQFLLMQTREWQHAAYVRDRWQLSRNLTLTLGLRYEYYPLIDRGNLNGVDRGIERWDPATNLVTLGGLGNVPKNNGITVSKTLFAPRVGFAYRLGDSSVIRSGYGITYDPLPFSRPLRGLYPSTITANYVPVDQFAFFNRLDQGIPEVPVPDISSGVVPLPPTVDMGPRSPWAGELTRGYIQSWNLTFERKMPWDMVGSVAYVGTQTTHQMADLDINAAAPGTGVEGRPLFATQGRRIAANMWDGWLSANYHALQTQLNKDFTGGLFLKGSYTWSRAMNMTDEDGWAGLPETNWLPALRRNYGPAGYDRRHMFTMAFVYSLPFGQGRSVALQGPADWILGGWQVSGLVSAYTGTPFTVRANSVSLNAPGSNQTADFVGSGEPRKIGDIGPGSTFYDPASFRDPNFGRPAGQFRFGATGRNTLYGPGFVRPDLTLSKIFSITERFKTEFRAEAFNFTNTPRFNNPADGNANVSSASLNADGTFRSLNNFMAVTTAQGERQIRFGLRMSF